MTSHMIEDDRYADGSEIVCFRRGYTYEYGVVFKGKLCSPRWVEKGPAEAYLSMLIRGQRQPELI